MKPVLMLKKSVPVILSLLTFFLGVWASYGAQVYFSEIEEERADKVFESSAVGVFYDTLSTFSAATDLRFAAKLMKIPNITCERFQDFTTHYLDRSELVGISYIPKVLDEQRQRYETEFCQKYPIRSMNFTQRGPGKLVSRDQAEFYYPVYFLEPSENNTAAYGFDLYSDPTRRAAIDKAIDTRSTTVTDRIELVQEDFGMLVVEPIEESEDLVTGVVRFSPLMRSVFHKSSKVVDVAELFLLDVRENAENDLIYSTAANLTTNAEVDAFLRSKEPSRVLRFTIPVADHLYQLVVTSSYEHQSILVSVLFITFALFSLLGSILIFVKIHQIGRVKLLYEEMARVRISEIRKTQFISTTSHEMRSPMHAIVNYLEQLEQTVSDAQREILDQLKMCSEHLLNLINDVLDITKIQSGKLSFEDVPFSLRECLDQVIVLSKPTATKRNIELRLRLEEPIHDRIRGDALRVKQVLLNLVSNAIKFSSPDSVVTITCELMDAGSEANTSEETHPLSPGKGNPFFLKFTVTDTGIGMSKEELGVVFDPFRQASSSTARKFGGTGLGLYICKQLSEGMGGGIWVQSYPGRGSSFSFTIKTRREKKITHRIVSEGSLSLNTAEPSTLQLLLAEDNLVNQRIFLHMLPDTFHVDTATNGAIAVERAKTKRYDIIFMDFNMPVLDGISATKAIRNSASANAQSLIVGISGDTALSEEDAEVCDFAACLIKPFTKKHLLDLIGRLTSEGSDQDSS